MPRGAPRHRISSRSFAAVFRVLAGDFLQRGGTSGMRTGRGRARPGESGRRGEPASSRSLSSVAIVARRTSHRVLRNRNPPVTNAHPRPVAPRLGGARGSPRRATSAARVARKGADRRRRGASRRSRCTERWAPVSVGVVPTRSSRPCSDGDRLALRGERRAPVRQAAERSQRAGDPRSPSSKSASRSRRAFFACAQVGVALAAVGHLVEDALLDAHRADHALHGRRSRNRWSQNVSPAAAERRRRRRSSSSSRGPRGGADRAADAGLSRPVKPPFRRISAAPAETSRGPSRRARRPLPHATDPSRGSNVRKGSSPVLFPRRRRTDARQSSCGIFSAWRPRRLPGVRGNAFQKVIGRPRREATS